MRSIITDGPLVAAIMTSIIDCSADSITKPSIFMTKFSKYFPVAIYIVWFALALFIASWIVLKGPFILSTIIVFFDIERCVVLKL